MTADLILEIVEGPAAGRQFEMSAGAEIGRSDEVAIHLSDNLVSRHHARIDEREGHFIVEDLESRNGTFVNGDLISAPARLDPGDQVLAGVTVLQVRTPAQVTQQPSAVHVVPQALSGAHPAPVVPAPAPAPAPTPASEEKSPLDPLFDARVKKQASAAPLAVFLLVAIVISLYLATR